MKRDNHDSDQLPHTVIPWGKFLADADFAEEQEEKDAEQDELAEDAAAGKEGEDKEVGIEVTGDAEGAAGGRGGGSSDL